MNNRQQLYVYNRKEICLFVIIFLLMLGFMFTLGIHLGKYLNPPKHPIFDRSISSVEDISDEAPNSHQLTAPDKAAQEKLEKDLKDQLKNEVTQSGLRTNQPKQLKLPETAKTKNAGATTLTKPLNPK